MKELNEEERSQPPEDSNQTADVPSRKRRKSTPKSDTPIVEAEELERMDQVADLEQGISFDYLLRPMSGLKRNSSNLSNGNRSYMSHQNELNSDGIQVIDDFESEFSDFDVKAAAQQDVSYEYSGRRQQASSNASIAAQHMKNAISNFISRIPSKVSLQSNVERNSQGRQVIDDFETPSGTSESRSPNKSSSLIARNEQE